MWPFTKSGSAGIPPGTGLYPVGCMDIMSDSSLSGTFLRLFYPTNKQNKNPSNFPPWLPSKEYARGYIDYTGFKNSRASFTAAILNYLTEDFKIPATWNAPLAKSESPFPVLIFSHGLSGCRTTYSTVCLEMASHGFIVGAVEHRDKSACTTYIIKEVSEENEEGCKAPSRGRIQEWIPILLVEGDDFEIRNNQLNTRAAECIRALDLLIRMNSGERVVNSLDDQFDATMFKNVMNVDKVGICGHSFGAATSILTLAKDKRFKCGVALDAWLFPVDKTSYADIEQPVLLINTEKFHWPANIAKMIRLVPDFNQPTDDRRMITIRGTVHQSQTDFTLLFRSSMSKWMGFAGTLDPKLGMEINLNATVAFLSAKLGLPYNKDYDKILLGENKHIIVGTNIKLDPDKVLETQASL
ncbi:platelet-activating factor acetylhydrolase 2, cytoplasmic-like [Asterias rubens]|uniref:platelet-activating factor acetylhydrolase 2, cytoplasmic-like n=1 Tax=Asterias rubens TaxID=7604 RepID=UPI001455A8DB|nr:platelet-activating factor acetylhydrolase 2, cytoplasmic-like [Asterias rubens]